MKKNLLLIDLNNIVMRSCHVNKDMFSSDHVFTGGLVGFLKMSCKYINDYGITHVAICSDSPPYKRTFKEGTYKGNRNTEEVQALRELREESLPLVETFAKLAGWPLFKEQGYEADDLIAYFANEYYDEFDKIYIGSNDSDYALLLDREEKINLIAKKKGSYFLYKHQHLMEEYGDITKDQLLTALAIAGTHNNIPGIYGYGMIKAVKAVKNPAMLEELEKKHPGLVAHNKELIQIPHKTFSAKLLLEVEKQNNKLNTSRRLAGLCATHDIDLQYFMMTALDQIR